MLRQHAATESRIVATGVLCAALAWVPAAQAQAINRCHIDGQLVLQSGPCPIEARPGVRTAPPASTQEALGTPRKKTLAEVLRARDGDDPAPGARPDQSDGALVLRSRMGAV